MTSGRANYPEQEKLNYDNPGDKLNQKFIISFLIVCLILISMPTALCKTPTAPIVYVAGDGVGTLTVRKRR